MPATIGSQKTISDAEQHLVGLITTSRKIRALEEAFLSGEITRLGRPIIVKLLSRFVSDNFNAKKDKSGKSFKATSPKESYRKWSRKMINTGTTVYVGAGVRRKVKHPGTPAWAGRRTDYLWDKMFKNRGTPLAKSILTSTTQTKTRIQSRFSMDPPNLEDFVNNYAVRFFSGGNNPFFLSKEQGRTLKEEMDKIINRVKRV